MTVPYHDEHLDKHTARVSTTSEGHQTHTMKAAIFKEVGSIAIVDRPKPEIKYPTYAIVKVLHASICGTDLHIIRGHVPTCMPGRILGHDGVGIIDTLGPGVTGLTFRRRDGMTSHCVQGGWILGHTIDGTQAEYVRIPHAAFSLYTLPPTADSQIAVALSNAFPTAYECAILPRKIRPASTLAIVGAGPVGLAVLILAKLFSPRLVVLIGQGETRLTAATQLGADRVLSSSLGNDKITESALAINEGEGFDIVVECVGIPETFDLSQRLLG